MDPVCFPAHGTKQYTTRPQSYNWAGLCSNRGVDVWGAPTLDVGDLYFDQNFHLGWLGCIYSAVLMAYDDGTKGAFSYRLVWSLLQWLGIGDWVSAVIGACLAGSWMW